MGSSHAKRRGVDHLSLGHHACHFYRSADDLNETLVPYFREGLERNESCIWVTSIPYESDRAISEMRAAVSDFDRRFAAGQIAILGYDEWYTKQEALKTDEVVHNWLERKDQALAAGYAGLRISGNTSFLDESTWDEFLQYERTIDDAFKDQPIATLCSYCTQRCPSSDRLEVIQRHGAGLARGGGHWHLLELESHHRHPLGFDLLEPAPRKRTELASLLEDQLAVYLVAHPDRVSLEGDPVQLSASLTTNLTTVIRLLTINALRHGAFSISDGMLTVRWQVVSNGSRRLRLEWVEEGSFGLLLSDEIGPGLALIAHLAGSFERSFEPARTLYTLDLPLEIDYPQSLSG
jgi:hypothetical protein